MERWVDLRTAMQRKKSGENEDEEIKNRGGGKGGKKRHIDDF